jgi:hypothetical protein
VGVRGLRVLTSAESIAVWHLIARSRRSMGPVDGIPSLPRRTFQTVRRRVYERGWIVDRFVPSPSVFGTGRIVFGLSQPLSDRAAYLIERWRARPETVLLWASDESVFGVFLEPVGDDHSLVDGLDIDRSSRDHCLIRVSLNRASVPAYFDYEAAWVRATGLPGVIGYPRSVQRDPSISGRINIRTPSLTQRQAVADLANSAAEHSRPPTAGPVASWLNRRSAEEKFMREGWGMFRSFLNPVEVARSVTGFPAWCAFVRGMLLPAARVRELFQALVAEAVVSPFIFATDEQQVLFATLSEGPGHRRKVDRVPVLAVVRRYLRDIAVVRLPLGSTRIIVDHAYGSNLGVRADGHPRVGP